MQLKESLIMAKQSVDKKTAELPLDEEWKELSALLSKMQSLAEYLDGLKERRNKSKRMMLELENQGIDYAGTHYKDGRYLYLVYPYGEDGSRKRTYIGADPVKVKAALDKLERGRKYDQLKREIRVIEGKISEIAKSIDSAIVYAAINGY